MGGNPQFAGGEPYHEIPMLRGYCVKLGGHGGTMSRAQDEEQAFFRSLLPDSEPLLGELEQEAAAQGVPIVGPLVGRLLCLLARATGARRVLELGAATGYSAIWLGRGLAPGGSLITLEQSPAMAARARANLARAGLDQACTVVEGPARELLPGLEGPFDLAFLDIDKGGYLPALGHLGRLVRPGGLLVADNTAFTAAADFCQALAADPRWLEAQILCFLPAHSPETDGLSLAVRV
eukprot:TRINITY_DN2888_c0_g1_i2.p4 TRINITY_DN2888_c0_g1~~TRINITY_DN2888_c0_g1_i2.p4  ORF type:complete len:236 (+),score=75.08 TRINITY_DN2888_c0_g1_i2:1007-1714(+)